MASFKKTKNRIQASIRMRGVKIYKTFPDKKSAKYWALNKEREILKGKVYELDKYLTLKDLLIRYQNEFTQFKSRPKQERQQIQRLILKYPWLVNARIAELTVSDFIKFKAQRVNDMGNNSFTNGFRATNGDLILIGSVYKKAIEVWNLGIYDLIPYDFRRNRIQKLIDKGYPIGYVALQVGHKSFDMLGRYYGIKLR